MVKHVGAEHTDILLDHVELADPDIRRRTVGARDMPGGLADMDASLYLLCKGIRKDATVALSGESADEIFGGYREFHVPRIQAADDLPWHVSPGSPCSPDNYLTAPALQQELQLDTYLQDHYRDAVAEVDRLDGEDSFGHRMRVMSHLYLTRFVRTLLDRKDRISMAVGLEVRVPFCDHRLVEYVYNTPWALKTYDGREKSLLRGAAEDLLPRSVLDRTKAIYPSTQDPRYTSEIQQQCKELLKSNDDVLFGLIDKAALAALCDQDPSTLWRPLRQRMENALEMATWLDIYKPTMQL
jgi:asparagine synthase (glutamine-hydrolysing)